MIPSRSLIPSQTASSIHFGTQIIPSLHEASPAETSVLYRRMSFLRHINGLWKGLAPRSKKQLTSRMLLQVSSPNESKSTLVSGSKPSPPQLTSSPPSPTLQTPVSLHAGWPWIAVSGTEVGDASIRPVQSLYPDLSRASIKPFSEPCRRHVSLSEDSGLSCMASTSPVIGASGSVLDAATRLQDFHSLIVEMRASLLDHDCETVVDAGERRDEEDIEIERLLRLLEDVMRKVKGLAEKDTGLGLPLIKIDTVP